MSIFELRFCRKLTSRSYSYTKINTTLYIIHEYIFILIYKYSSLYTHTRTHIYIYLYIYRYSCKKNIELERKMKITHYVHNIMCIPFYYFKSHTSKLLCTSLWRWRCTFSSVIVVSLTYIGNKIICVPAEFPIHPV